MFCEKPHFLGILGIIYVKFPHAQFKPNLFISLEIKIKPTLTKTIEDITIDPETDVTLSCAAIGKPKPVFSWYKNGKLRGAGIDGNLFLREVTESANYTCQARNGADGTAESTAQITVRRKLTLFLHKLLDFLIGQIFSDNTRDGIIILTAKSYLNYFSQCLLCVCERCFT